MVELLRNVLAEGIAGTPGGDAPAGAVIGVGPEEVAHGTLVGHLLHSIELAHLVETVKGGRETAVETEDLLFHHSSEG